MGASLRTENAPPPPLLPSSTSSLVPGHVGLRQHPSTVGALPLLCSVHSWCKGVGALSCILSSSCFPGLSLQCPHGLRMFFYALLCCFWRHLCHMFCTLLYWDLPLSLPCTSFHGSSSYSLRQKWRCNYCM